ncbi:Tumor protein D52 [Labeo rohita]|uniref:Tumor protein D52 n=1 Tax=Labeo rohita TaxID=84645 RepID=A0ABQ8LQ14_LABRO|nr:Tumor protein D52 [Labeo rohita]
MEEPVEEYKSPFNFEQGVNTSYLYLSPEESFTPPGSPVLALRGPKSPDFIPEVGEDAVNAVPSSPSMALTEEEQTELQSELAKVEDEIQTLSQVLVAKEKQVAEIKRKLGITPLNEFKQNLSKGWHEVTTSTAYVPSLASGICVPPAASHTAAEERLHLYKKTSETLSQVGQKATTAFSSVGSAITRKLEDTKMSPTPSTGDGEEVSESTPDGKPVAEQPEETGQDIL